MSGQLPQSFLWNVTMTYGAFEAGVDQAKRTQCLDRRELAIKNTYRRNRKIPDSVKLSWLEDRTAAGLQIR